MLGYILLVNGGITTEELKNGIDKMNLLIDKLEYSCEFLRLIEKIETASFKTKKEKKEVLRKLNDLFKSEFFDITFSINDQLLALNCMLVAKIRANKAQP